MSESKYKIVIFDLDDTLLESRVAKWAQHTYVAKKFYNIDLTEKLILINESGIDLYNFRI